MSTLPAALCPVCADLLEQDVRSCERCGTPHHQECWDYLPGCAVFACEEQAQEVPVASWPVAYRLLLLRTRVAVSAYWTLLGSAGLLSLAATLDIPPSLIPDGLGTWLVGGSLTLLVAGLVQAMTWGGLAIGARASGGHELAERIRGQGDRKLQAAIETRLQAPTRTASHRFLLGMGFMVAGSQALKELVFGNFEGLSSILIAAIVTFACGLLYAAFLSLPVYLGLALLARERVLANRVQVALPQKPKS